MVGRQRLRPRDFWTLDGSTTSLKKHAQRYLKTHPFLQAAQETYEPPPDPADKYWPRYADGSKIPADLVDAGTMFNIQARLDADKAAEARGPQPEPESPESIAARTAARTAAVREELRRDAAEAHRAQLAKGGAKVGDGSMLEPVLPGVSPEHRNLYESEPSADDLFAAAGPDPNPWKP